MFNLTTKSISLHVGRNERRSKRLSGRRQEELDALRTLQLDDYDAAAVLVELVQWAARELAPNVLGQWARPNAKGLTNGGTSRAKIGAQNSLADSDDESDAPIVEDCDESEKLDGSVCEYINVILNVCASVIATKTACVSLASECLNLVQIVNEQIDVENLLARSETSVNLEDSSSVGSETISKVLCGCLIILREVDDYLLTVSSSESEVLMKEKLIPLITSFARIAVQNFVIEEEVYKIIVSLLEFYHEEMMSDILKLISDRYQTCKISCDVFVRLIKNNKILIKELPDNFLPNENQETENVDIPENIDIPNAIPEEL